MGACKAFISLYKVYMNHTTIVLLYKSLLLKQTVIFKEKMLDCSKQNILP